MSQAIILKEAYCSYTTLAQPFVMAPDLEPLLRDVGYQLAPEQLEQARARVVKNGTVSLEDFAAYCGEHPIEPLDEEQLRAGFAQLQRLFANAKVFPAEATEHQKLAALLQTAGSRYNGRRQQSEFDLGDAELRFAEAHVLRGAIKDGVISYEKLIQKLKAQ